MFGSFLQGFIGKFIAGVGVVICLPAGCMLAVWGMGDDGYFEGLFLLGLLMIFGGGYMDYLSKQTVRVGGDLTSSNSESQNSAVVASSKRPYSGARDTRDQAYQLFLVEKYEIKRNDTLNIYTMGGQAYSTVDEAIQAAHSKDESADRAN